MIQIETNILLESGTNELEIVEFLIKMRSGNEQSFGINVAKVREIINVPQYDEVPNSDTNIKGIFQLRNNIIPLIDLSYYLNQNTDADQKFLKVIVTEFNNQNFGFLIHKISTIHRISWKKVMSPNDVLTHINKNCVVAMVPMEEKTILMLDFEKIIMDINPQSGLNIADAQAEVAEKTEKEYKVLLADDSPTIRTLISGLMTKGGFRIETVNNGQLAIDLLMSAKQQAEESGKSITDFYDLIITDIEMPQMDGHALCKAIENDDRLSQLPVILFSSIIYDELRSKGDAVGADAQITKPQIKDVVHIAKDLLKKYEDNSKKKKVEESTEETPKPVDEPAK